MERVRLQSEYNRSAGAKSTGCCSVSKKYTGHLTPHSGVADRWSCEPLSHGRPLPQLCVLSQVGKHPSAPCLPARSPPFPTGPAHQRAPPHLEATSLASTDAAGALGGIRGCFPSQSWRQLTPRPLTAAPTPLPWWQTGTRPPPPLDLPTAFSSNATTVPPPPPPPCASKRTPPSPRTRC